jgi:hypothetical protein
MLGTAAVLLLLRAPVIEAPFTIADSAIVIDVTVNDKPVSVMFDTGFAGEFVLSSHLKLGKATGKITLQDFVGAFDASTVDVNSLSVAGNVVDLDEGQIVQQPLQSLSLSYGTHCDGIMGVGVFMKYVVEINFEDKILRLHPKSHDITQNSADKEKTFLRRMLPIGHNTIEMRVKAPTGKRLNLALDTGNAFYATTHTEVLVRTGLWKEGKKPKFMGQSWVASGPVSSWNIALEDMEIFGVPTKKTVWNIIDRPSSSASHDGTVGFGFLKNFNITFDFTRRYVWMERFTDTVDYEAPGHIGLAAAYDPKKERVRVFNVVPEGPADKAGIKYGDDILAIGKTDIKVVGFRNLNEMMQGPPGSVVKLSLSRGGKLMRKELTRTQLVN